MHDEKEDIEASEAANVNLLERPRSSLATLMAKFPKESDAWQDFSELVDEMLGVELERKTADNVGVPSDIWDYWKGVVAGTNPDYDSNGQRISDQ